MTVRKLQYLQSATCNHLFVVMGSLILALVAALVMPASLAKSHDNPNPTYLVVNYIGQPHKCITIYGAFTGNDVGAIQWQCVEGTNQQMEIIHTSDGFHQLRFKHSGRCLEAVTPSFNGASVVQRTCNTKTCTTAACDRQKWSGVALSPMDLRHFDLNFQPDRIRNKGTTRCLTVHNASTSDGAAIIQWDCSANSYNQYWRTWETFFSYSSPTYLLRDDQSGTPGGNRFYGQQIISYRTQTSSMIDPFTTALRFRVYQWGHSINCTRNEARFKEPQGGGPNYVAPKWHWSPAFEDPFVWITAWFTHEVSPANMFHTDLFLKGGQSAESRFRLKGQVAQAACLEEEIAFAHFASYGGVITYFTVNNSIVSDPYCQQAC